jgi:hypothetical protein
MMMQILRRGGFPVAFDELRGSNYHNPKGYYELEGGKIIDRLMNGTFSFEKYDEKAIKITAYGLTFLPPGRYRIIYMRRHLDEILDSMEKMSGPIDRENEKPLFEKLDALSLTIMETRDDIAYRVVNYRDVITDPVQEIEKISLFIGPFDVAAAAQAVDPSLYRNVRDE